MPQSVLRVNPRGMDQFFWVVLIIVVGFAVILVHFAVQLAIDATYLATGREVPPWWVAEAAHGGEDLATAETTATAGDGDAFAKAPR